MQLKDCGERDWRNLQVLRSLQKNNDLHERPCPARSVGPTLWDFDCCEIDGVPADDTQGQVALTSAAADGPVGVNHGADALPGGKSL